MSERGKCLGFLVIFGIGLAVSAVHPKDYFTWFLEILPALITLAVLLATYRHYRCTDMVYCLLLLECYILFVGGHYTYAEVPLFDWIRDYFGHSRNNFDKLAHFSQGFVPAMVFRELFIRFRVFARLAWLPYLVVCVCVTVSAVYEFFEWFVAVATGEAAEAFLGTQGYVWDTQSDMLMAMVGAATALLTLSQWQDRQINAIGG